jgi:hypothetical protein
MKISIKATPWSYGITPTGFAILDSARAIVADVHDRGGALGVAEAHEIAKGIVELPVLLRQIEAACETLEDLNAYWDGGTPIHPGSDVATNARSLMRAIQSTVKRLKS